MRWLCQVHRNTAGIKMSLSGASLLGMWIIRRQPILSADAAPPRTPMIMSQALAQHWTPLCWVLFFCSAQTTQLYAALWEHETLETRKQEVKKIHLARVEVLCGKCKLLRLALSNIGAVSHMWLVKLKWIKIKGNLAFCSSVTFPPLRLLVSYM